MRNEKKLTIWDHLLCFESFLAPKLIEWFWLVIAGLGSIVLAILAVISIFTTGIMSTLIIMLGWGIFLVCLRVVMEVYILLFKIYEKL